MVCTPPSGWFPRHGEVYLVRLQTCVDIDADVHPKYCARNSKWRCSGLGIRGRHDGKRPLQMPHDASPRCWCVLLVLVNAACRGADELPGGHLPKCLDPLSHGTRNRHDVACGLQDSDSQPMRLPAALFDLRTGPAIELFGDLNKQDT